MNKEELAGRFKKFALRIIKVANALPKNDSGRVISKQIIRSGTSGAANYRAACRARSNNEFISKLCIVEEELDETMFWIEIIIESHLLRKELLLDVYNEANELISITISSKKTARKR